MQQKVFLVSYSIVLLIFTNMNWLSIRGIISKAIPSARLILLFTGVRSKFTSLWNATKDIFTKLRNWMSNIWNSIKDNTVGIAGR